MKKKPRSCRVYSVDFKQEAVRRMAQAETIVGLAQELGIRRKLLYQWRDQFQAGDRVGLERRRGRPPGSRSQTVSPAAPSAADLRIAELERLLGRKQLEVDFLERAFEQVRGAASIRNWGAQKNAQDSRSRPPNAKRRAGRASECRGGCRRKRSFANTGTQTEIAPAVAKKVK
jgi:transposase-like protein